MVRALSMLVAMVSLSMAPIAFGADLHVSPQGDDGNPGTLDKPFKTLERARDAVRTLRERNQGQAPAGGVTVWLRGGRYELRETFVLGPEDSGQEGRPVVYRAYEGECPVLSGGRVIRGWKKVEGNLPGLPEAAHEKVWAAGSRRWVFLQCHRPDQRTAGLPACRYSRVSTTEKHASSERSRSVRPPSSLFRVREPSGRQR
jgi:hypothetical protein